jgi:hypothetical protein
VLARLDLPQTQTTPAEREALASFLPGANIEHFRDHIRHDPRIEIVRQRDSLSVLRKR